MNTNKTKKIFLLVALIVASLLCFVCAGAFLTTTFADDEVNGDSDNVAYYFDNASASFSDDTLNLSLTANGSATFKRELEVSAFNLDFNTDDNYVTLKITLTYASVNSYESTVKDVITVEKTASGADVSLNDGDKSAITLSSGYSVTIAGGIISVNGTAIGNVNSNARVYSDGKVFATLAFVAEENAVIKIAKINEQDFVFDSATHNFVNKKTGVTKINYDFYHMVGDKNVKIWQLSSSYPLTAKYAGAAYDKNLATLTVKTSPDYTVSSNKIMFHKTGDVTTTFSNDYTETVHVVNYEDDTTAPVYDSAKFTAWKEQVKIAFDAQKAGLYKNEKLTLPSLLDVVSDDVYDYSLLTYVLHYTTESNDDLTVSGKASDEITLTIKEQGDYHCYIVFSDGKPTEANAMDEDDCKANYSFTIENVTYLKVPSVKASTATVTPGYLETSYSANSFTVKGADETTYSLWYRAKADDTPVRVYAKSDENYDEDNEICVDYAGGLTFTPLKLGIYTIRCTARLNEPGISETANDELDINVIAKPKIVKPATELTRNNILSIVFLCVGVVALVGLVCVIFVKPKNKSVDQD